MGEASMRKWMRRARRSLPSGPNFSPARDFICWIALRERREHRAERRAQRMARAMSKVNESIRSTFASHIAALVSPNNAILRRLGFHA